MASSTLDDKLAAIEADARAKSDDIAAKSEAVRQEWAEKAEQSRQENVALCEELDARSEQQKAAMEDPKASNAWALKERSDDEMSIGQVEDDFHDDDFGDETWKR